MANKGRLKAMPCLTWAHLILSNGQIRNIACSWWEGIEHSVISWKVSPCHFSPKRGEKKNKIQVALCWSSRCFHLFHTNLIQSLSLVRFSAKPSLSWSSIKFILTLIIIFPFHSGKLRLRIYGHHPKLVSDQMRLKPRDYVIMLTHHDRDLLWVKEGVY